MFAKLRQVRKMTYVVLAVAAVALAVPALASANAATSTVARQFSTQLHNRARLSGIAITSTSVRCASDGGGYYSCWATYTGLVDNVHAKFGIYINVTPTRWYTVGTPRELNIW